MIRSRVDNTTQTHCCSDLWQSCVCSRPCAVRQDLMYVYELFQLLILSFLCSVLHRWQCFMTCSSCVLVLKHSEHECADLTINTWPPQKVLWLTGSQCLLSILFLQPCPLVIWSAKMRFIIRCKQGQYFCNMFLNGFLEFGHLKHRRKKLVVINTGFVVYLWGLLTLRKIHNISSLIL